MRRKERRRPVAGAAVKAIGKNTRKSPLSNSTAPQDQAFEAYLRQRRFERDVTRVHRLGPRVVAEMLGELRAKSLLRSAIDEIVGRYARLDREVDEVTGGDRMPPAPIWGVPR
jgi:hypothetical protein